MDLNDYSVVKNLVEGYYAVYEDQIEEKTVTELDAIQRAKIAQQAAEARRKKEERQKSAKAFQAHRAEVLSQGGTPVDALDSWNRQKLGMKEDFDLFDYLLEYLISEGYADTNENAIAIMANMSEDWRESIIEGRVESETLTSDQRRRARNDRYREENPLTPSGNPTGSNAQLLRQMAHAKRRGIKKR